MRVQKGKKETKAVRDLIPLGQSSEIQTNQTESKTEKVASLKGSQTESTDQQQDQPREKRKYTRRKPVQAEVLDDQDKERMMKGFQLFTGYALDFIATRMPNPIPATQLEKEMIGTGVDLCLEKYLPLFMPYAPVIILGLSGGMFALPRLNKPQTPAAPVATDTAPEKSTTPAASDSAIETAETMTQDKENAE